MSDSPSVPGAWNSMWDSLPTTGTQDHEARQESILPEGTGGQRTVFQSGGRSFVPTFNATTQGGRGTAHPRVGSAADISSGVQGSDVSGDNKPPIVIAVFGQTGTGKTSFIKAATGRDLQVGHSLTSCTEDVLAVACRIGGENVMLVDTPGFSDTKLSDTEILRRIAAWMKDTYDDGCLLSGIIYLHRIIDPRMDGPSLKNLRMMRKLCGTHSLKNVVLATTFWEKVDFDEGLRREEELREDFWKDMIEGGSTVAKIRTELGDDAHDLVKSLLKNKPTSTRLQEELHSGKTLIQTEAGAEIKEELAKLERKLKAEHEEAIAELKRAQRDRDRALEQQIQEEIARNDKRFTSIQFEKESLRTGTPRSLPKAKRQGIFGWGSYVCKYCGKKTRTYGRWTCSNCKHQQRNVW